MKPVFFERICEDLRVLTYFRPHNQFIERIIVREKTSFIDGIGYLIGIVVIGFIIFILIWPIIDPTPEKSSTLQENAEHLNFK